MHVMGTRRQQDPHRGDDEGMAVRPATINPDGTGYNG